MRWIAALACMLGAAFLNCQLPTAQAQEPPPSGIGEHPLLPSAAPTNRPRTPLPITLDFSLPEEQKWLAEINASPGAAATTTETAGDAPASDNEATTSDVCQCKHPWEIFHRKQVEVQVMTGITYFPIGLGPAGPTTIFLPQQLRLGYMINDPHPDRRFRGTWEVIFEFNTSPIVKGPGSIIVGGALYGRYNFSCSNRRLIPYFEMGGGGSWTDAYKFRPTNLSTGFEFIIHCAPGVHYLINSQWALSAEFAYYHFSNSGINVHNFGINTWGGLFGITHFFR